MFGLAEPIPGEVRASPQRTKEAGLGRIVVMNHVTLDGVMQGPGRPGEDTRGGFTYGGWASLGETPDEAPGRAMGERMAAGGGLAGWVFGRRTYDDLLGYWNEQPDSAFGPMLNSAQKYVVSTHVDQRLRWPNSTLVSGDVLDALSALKRRVEGVLGIMGSGQLIASLMSAELIDEYLLMIHPLVLGGGRRLFPEGVHVQLRLVDWVVADSGLAIATYEPARRD